MKEGREEGNKELERGREGRQEAEDYFALPRGLGLPGYGAPWQLAHQESSTLKVEGPIPALALLGPWAWLSLFSFPVWKRGQSSPCGRVRDSPT